MTEARSPRGKSVHFEEFPEGALSLDELCDLAAVTVRTVRYYISEGLLPPPRGHGVTAHYAQEHLDRLTVIGLMKERFLPLKEIRRTLDQMSDREIAEAAAAAAVHQSHDVAPAATKSIRTPDRDGSPEFTVGESVVSYAMAPSTEFSGEYSAADYIADVLEHRTARARSAPHRPAPQPGKALAWRRLAISDDAELLIEEGAYQRRRERIESLVAWAQRILKGS